MTGVQKCGDLLNQQGMASKTRAITVENLNPVRIMSYITVENLNRACICHDIPRR